MEKPEFAAPPSLKLTSFGFWSGDAKRSTSRNRARPPRCFGVAKFFYREPLRNRHMKNVLEDFKNLTLFSRAD